MADKSAFAIENAVFRIPMGTFAVRPDVRGGDRDRHVRIVDFVVEESGSNRRKP
jgi:hypothetical protein